ncbi:hypothetical protein IIC38_01420 [candidate division KSB1 bacterium]|nr:hypothetical protein [candidate division KSB1 bacterium]
MNSETRIIITGTGASAEHLRRFVKTGDEEELRDLLNEDENQALNAIPDQIERRVSRFASYCLRAIKAAKGQHAFDLAFILQRILNHQKFGWITFKIPEHIENAIRWGCHTEKDDAAS